MAAKKGSLSINSDNIFPIIKKWLYSDHDIFYRELISNGCDAITKLKKLDMMGEYELPEGYKPRIDVIVNPEKKTLTFKDNGLGMTADEVEEYINQIAFSGAADFIEKYTGKNYPEGDFVDVNGNVLGRHKGIIRYTIGQRKGLGLALKEPMYVKEVNTENNTVVLAREKELYDKVLTADDVNLISVEEIKEPMRVKAKVRYRQPEQWATVTQTGADEIRVEFDEPQRAITKGQSVVLYDGDVIVGGGTIKTVGEV